MTSFQRTLGFVAVAGLSIVTVAARRPSEARPLHAAAMIHGVATQRTVGSDPPGFGIVPVAPGQTIRLNVVCYPHAVGAIPPGPCRGVIMFHDAAGNLIRQGTVDLKPGETSGLGFTYTPVGTNAPAPILADPCWIPSPGGRAIPSVEVFDGNGRVVHYVNPAAGRMAEVSNGGGIIDPGSIVGFNPQPDPPGFGFITLRSEQQLKMHVVCFAHPVGLSTFAPPCRGTIMFHDATGNVLQTSTYALKPGEVATIGFQPPPSTGVTADAAVAFLGIAPCVIPSPGGRAIPNVEIIDADGQTAHLINPAVIRLSELDQ